MQQRSLTQGFPPGPWPVLANPTRHSADGWVFYLRYLLCLNSYSAAKYSPYFSYAENGAQRESKTRLSSQAVNRREGFGLIPSGPSPVIILASHGGRREVGGGLKTECRTSDALKALGT